MTELRVGKGPKPVVLCILDGWGDRTDTADNAIALADTPNWDRMTATYPRAQLDASAHEVGLPEGQMGNSEVGHMNLGAGRVVMQDLPRIDEAIADGSVYQSAELAHFISALQSSGGACHLMGLMSPGGVHSMQDHMAAMARHVAAAGMPVVVHAFLDGRDTPPASGADFMAQFTEDVSDVAGLTFGVVSGRYYAMDRDKRWDRVVQAYDALVDGKGERAQDPVSAIRASYDAGTTDEFVLPTVVDGYQGMKDGDGVFMANFRADRAREILAALADPEFDGFARARTVDFAARLGMVEYSTDLNQFFQVLFPPLALSNILGSVLADAGLRQLRIAETEKYAHVTFFFNGGEEKVFPGEQRILVPSPKVATYDLQPAMSAPEVTDKLVAAIESGEFEVIIVNYANGDMVGHTGILDAAKQAAQTVDNALGRLETVVKAAGGTMLVTADHGNAEMMRDPDTGQPHTAHTLNKVPAVLVNNPPGVSVLHDGRLADVAPTLLDLLGIDLPAEMTGRSLIGTDSTAQTAAAE